MQRHSFSIATLLALTIFSALFPVGSAQAEGVSSVVIQGTEDGAFIVSSSIDLLCLLPAGISPGSSGQAFVSCELIADLPESSQGEDAAAASRCTRVAFSLSGSGQGSVAGSATCSNFGVGCGFSVPPSRSCSVAANGNGQSPYTCRVSWSGRVSWSATCTFWR